MVTHQRRWAVGRYEMPKTQYLDRAKVFPSRVDARWASALAQENASYSDGVAVAVTGGYVALVLVDGEFGETFDTFVTA